MNAMTLEHRAFIIGALMALDFAGLSIGDAEFVLNEMGITPDEVKVHYATLTDDEIIAVLKKIGHFRR
jgi:uncharacterized protein Smg (DUF494 family)